MLQRALNALTLKKGYEPSPSRTLRAANVGRSPSMLTIPQDDLKRSGLETFAASCSIIRGRFGGFGQCWQTKFGLQSPDVRHAASTSKPVSALVATTRRCRPCTIRQILSDLVRDNSTPVQARIQWRYSS